MDLEINSGTSTGGKGIKHIWRPREDAALVEALSELCISGHWKVENGFRAGYLTQLEKKMAEKLSNCDLKATPHIESRVKTLKKQTLAINDMLSNSSGFAWNDDQKMVVCEKQVYEQWAKVHTAARGLRNKPFPHYDSLIEIFGKDRATRKGAEGPVEAVEDLTNDDHSAFNFEDVTNDEVEDTTPPTKTPICPSRGGLKRKRNTESWSDNLGDMISTLRSFVEVTKTHYDTMREVFAGEHAATQRRGKVVDELMQIEGLTSTDVLEACAAIIGDDSKIDLLFSLPAYLKRQWVDMLLNRQ